MNNQKDQAENSPRRSGRLLFTGFSMGVADLVPGVSGGTIALLYGIYDELLYSIKVVTGEVPGLIFKKQFRRAFQLVPWNFLIPVFIGILSAVLALIRVISFLLASYPVYVWSLFFGLIISSVYIVGKRIDTWDVKKYSFMLAGGVITFLLVGISSSQIEPTNFNVLGAGTAASAALILPGISGSLILVLLGQYENVVNIVVNQNYLLLTIFVGGAILGVAILSRLLSWLLERYHNTTLAFLVGVMIGSLRRVWPWQNEVADHVYANVLPTINSSFFLSLLLMATGALIVWQLERIGIAEEHDDIEKNKPQTINI